MKYEKNLKVLFVSSGNSQAGISPIVKSQGESLRKVGVDIDFFTVIGKGLTGYLKNVLPLRRYMRKNKYDIVHAHYSLSALAATLAGANPLVVSLMGSDVRLSFIYRKAVKFSSLLFWKALLVKSQDMLDIIGITQSKIIPNGIDTNLFRPLDKPACQKELDWDPGKNHILFAANPARKVKNFQLLEQALGFLDFPRKIVLHALENIPHPEIPLHMNASDLVVLTSLWEGSPNVVKEAMACNCPIVSTDVGDVRWLFGDLEGHYITSFDPQDVADKIKMALKFAEQQGKTQGRNRVIELGLDSETVARKIVGVYEEVLEESKKAT